jgi:hypothetical protein
MLKGSNRLMGENSPNPVTLAVTRVPRQEKNLSE